jgi:hypothetical protein
LNKSEKSSNLETKKNRKETGKPKRQKKRKTVGRSNTNMDVRHLVATGPLGVPFPVPNLSSSFASSEA